MLHWTSQWWPDTEDLSTTLYGLIRRRQQTLVQSVGSRLRCAQAVHAHLNAAAEAPAVVVTWGCFRPYWKLPAKSAGKPVGRAKLVVRGLGCATNGSFTTRSLVLPYKIFCAFACGPCKLDGDLAWTTGVVALVNALRSPEIRQHRRHQSRQLC